MQRIRQWMLGGCLLLLTLLLGCGSSGAGEIIRYDLPGSVTNLDPQFATDEAARMIISNSFDGLLRQNPDGGLELNVAESFTVSDDGLTYTFILREGEVWSDGSNEDSQIPLTAHDFVFAFHRIFDPAVPSPFASIFFSLENAQEVLRGSLPVSRLGVQALDALTLRFTLSRPDSRLPELLASTAAVPCNEEFFRSTRARYGLDLKSLRFNGAFYVRNWDEAKGLVSLRANRRYARKELVSAGGVDLYLPSAQETDMESRFFADKTDACKVDYAAAKSLVQEGGQAVAFEDTVWVLALNLSHPQLANTDLRRAIAYAINREDIAARTPADLRLTSVFIPPSVGSSGGSFRSLVGEGSPLAHSPELAKRSLQAAIGDLGVNAVSPITEILVCDEGAQPLLAGLVQKDLQSLSISTGLVRLPRAQLLERVNKGDYALAILPLSAAYSSPDSLLSAFRSDSSENITGYSNQTYDRLLDQTAAAAGEEQYRLFSQAEQLLLSDCPVIPLYVETSYYVMAKGVSEIHFSPFLSGIDFRDARKK